MFKIGDKIEFQNYCDAMISRTHTPFSHDELEFFNNNNLIVKDIRPYDYYSKSINRYEYYTRFGYLNILSKNYCSDNMKYDIEIGMENGSRIVGMTNTFNAIFLKKKNVEFDIHVGMEFVDLGYFIDHKKVVVSKIKSFTPGYSYAIDEDGDLMIIRAIIPILTKNKMLIKYA